MRFLCCYILILFLLQIYERKNLQSNLIPLFYESFLNSKEVYLNFINYFGKGSLTNFFSSEDL